ncbi:MAG: hypothetical protein R3C18_04270 [Planctomycetaceae bacterium]
MSEKSGGWGWFVGCAGVGCLAVLLCGGAAVWLIKAGGEQVQKEIARAQFKLEWMPPTEGTTGVDLFPEAVDQYTLTGDSDMASVSEFGIDDEVAHATYTGPDGNIDVYISETDFGTINGYFETLKANIEQRNGSKSTYFIDGAHSYFSVSPPQQTGWMWTSDGWVVLVVSDSEYDPEPFMEAYLTAIAGEEVADVWDPVPEEPTGEAPMDEGAGEPTIEEPQDPDTLDAVTKPAFKPGKEEETAPEEESVPVE